jgi:hypothetical protein
MRIPSEHRALMALGQKLRAAVDMTPKLMAEILDVTRRHVLFQGHRARTLRLKQLIDAGAWTDASLALLELELPLWQIRRIAYDAGEWHCALSRQRELPDWLDQSIESRHSDLALAILTAFVEARNASASSSRPSVPTVARKPDVGCIPLCCENFS